MPGEPWDPGDRYGRPPGRAGRRAAVAAGAAGLVVALGVLAWVALAVADRDARWRVVAFEVASASEVELTFEVAGDEGSRLRCVLRASEAGGGDVGRLEHDVGPLGGGWQRETVSIETLRPAVRASVRTCVPLPERLP